MYKCQKCKTYAVKVDRRHRCKACAAKMYDCKNCGVSVPKPNSRCEACEKGWI